MDEFPELFPEPVDEFPELLPEPLLIPLPFEELPPELPPFGESFPELSDELPFFDFDTLMETVPVIFSPGIV